MRSMPLDMGWRRIRWCFDHDEGGREEEETGTGLLPIHRTESAAQRDGAPWTRQGVIQVREFFFSWLAFRLVLHMY